MKKRDETGEHGNSRWVRPFQCEESRFLGIWICKNEAREAAQCTEVLATRSHILMVEESQLQNLSYHFYICTAACLCTHKINKCNKNNIFNYKKKEFERFWRCNPQNIVVSWLVRQEIENTKGCHVLNWRQDQSAWHGNFCLGFPRTWSRNQVGNSKLWLGDPNS